VRPPSGANGLRAQTAFGRTRRRAGAARGGAGGGAPQLIAVWPRPLPGPRALAVCPRPAPRAVTRGRSRSLFRRSVACSGAAKGKGGRAYGRGPRGRRGARSPAGPASGLERARLRVGGRAPDSRLSEGAGRRFVRRGEMRYLSVTSSKPSAFASCRGAGAQVAGRGAGNRVWVLAPGSGSASGLGLGLGFGFRVRVADSGFGFGSRARGEL